MIEDKGFIEIYKHQKFWRKKLPNGSYQKFNSVEEAKKAMGFIKDNPAFDFNLTIDHKWELHENGVYLSYTVTFKNDEMQQKWLDNKHYHDKWGCYLKPGVAFDPLKCRFDW